LPPQLNLQSFDHTKPTCLCTNRISELASIRFMIWNLPHRKLNWNWNDTKWN